MEGTEKMEQQQQEQCPDDEVEKAVARLLDGDTLLGLPLREGQRSADLARSIAMAVPSAIKAGMSVSIFKVVVPGALVFWFATPDTKCAKLRHAEFAARFCEVDAVRVGALQTEPMDLSMPPTVLVQYSLYFYNKSHYEENLKSLSAAFQVHSKLQVAVGGDVYEVFGSSPEITDADRFSVDNLLWGARVPPERMPRIRVVYNTPGIAKHTPIHDLLAILRQVYTPHQ